MAITGTKVEVTKADIATLIQQAPSRVWRPRTCRIGPLPADQKFAVVALALAPGVTIADHDALMVEIEAIIGIQKAIAVSYGIGPSAGEIPVDHDAQLVVETGIAFKDNMPTI